MVDYSTRKLCKGDEAPYRLLRLECLKNYPDNFGSTYEEESKKEVFEFEQYLKENHAHNFILGAFFNNELIGMVGFRRNNRLKTEHKGEIVSMYVSPSHSGKGIGLRLLKQIVALCFDIPGLEELKLGVVENNISAISLYEKVGFEKYCVEENNFKDGNRYFHQAFMKLAKKDYLSR